MVAPPGPCRTRRHSPLQRFTYGAPDLVPERMPLMRLALCWLLAGLRPTMRCPSCDCRIHDVAMHKPDRWIGFLGDTVLRWDAVKAALAGTGSVAKVRRWLGGLNQWADGSMWVNWPGGGLPHVLHGYIARRRHAVSGNLFSCLPLFPPPPRCVRPSTERWISVATTCSAA